MSDILIKGMEMPKSCSVCPLKAEVEFDEICSQTGEYVCQYDRADDCPLVPVPPHGRLIEDTAVREQIDEWLDSVGDVVVGHGLSYYGELLGCIEDAPTIIPAEDDTEFFTKGHWHLGYAEEGET